MPYPFPSWEDRHHDGQGEPTHRDRAEDATPPSTSPLGHRFREGSRSTLMASARIPTWCFRAARGVRRRLLLASVPRAPDRGPRPTPPTGDPMKTIGTSNGLPSGDQALEAGAMDREADLGARATRRSRRSCCQRPRPVRLRTGPAPDPEQRRTASGTCHTSAVTSGRPPGTSGRHRTASLPQRGEADVSHQRLDPAQLRLPIIAAVHYELVSFKTVVE